MTNNSQKDDVVEFAKIWKEKEQDVFLRINELFYPWQDDVIAVESIMVGTIYSDSHGIHFRPKASGRLVIPEVIKELIKWNITSHLKMDKASDLVETFYNLAAEKIAMEFFPGYNYILSSENYNVNEYRRIFRAEFDNYYRREYKYLNFVKWLQGICKEKAVDFILTG